MSRTLTISDELYARLETEARKKSAGSIEKLLEQTHVETSRISDEELRRQEAVAATIALQECLSQTMGQMPDSADLVREDRER